MLFPLTCFDSAEDALLPSKLFRHKRSSHLVPVV